MMINEPEYFVIVALWDVHRVGERGLIHQHFTRGRRISTTPPAITGHRFAVMIA
jgi:hypothetical protein